VVQSGFLSKLADQHYAEISGHPSPTRERPTNSEPNSIANPAAEDGRQLIREQSSSRRTDGHDDIAASKSRYAAPDASVIQFPTREQHTYSDPDAIANPADPRPGQSLIEGIMSRIDGSNLIPALASGCRPVQHLVWQRL